MSVSINRNQLVAIVIVVLAALSQGFQPEPRAKLISSRAFLGRSIVQSLSANIMLPDQTELDYTYNVEDSFVVSDVYVKINSLYHSFLGDLELKLTKDNLIVFLNKPDTKHSWDLDGTYTFKDAADATLEEAAKVLDTPSSSTRIPSGDYQPSVGESLRTTFSGLEASGRWTLSLRDISPVDDGEMNSAELVLVDHNGFERTYFMNIEAVIRTLPKDENGYPCGHLFQVEDDGTRGEAILVVDTKLTHPSGQLIYFEATELGSCLFNYNVGLDGHLSEISQMAVQVECGNGVIDSQEACDDDNNVDGDGCSVICTVEEGWVCSGSPSFCHGHCGDGRVMGGEECDDGNSSSGDGCSNFCRVEDIYSPDDRCGNGNLDDAETCDDSNRSNDDGCSSECSEEFGYHCPHGYGCHSHCGDGSRASNEGCDDGNGEDGDGCTGACHIEPGWACHGEEPSECSYIGSLSTHANPRASDAFARTCFNNDMLLRLHGRVVVDNGAHVKAVIDVTDDYTIYDVRVRINSLIHNNIGDLQLKLAFRGVEVVLLSRDLALTGSLYGDYVFLDEADTSLQEAECDGGEIPASDYRPQRGYSFRGMFGGLPASGGWEFVIKDFEDISFGEFDSFVLTLVDSVGRERDYYMSLNGHLRSLPMDMEGERCGRLFQVTEEMTIGEEILSPNSVVTHSSGQLLWYESVEIGTCSFEFSLPCHNEEWATVTVYTVCGNGLWDDGEECDDGNTIDGDGCSSCCEVEDGWNCETEECTALCGDGLLTIDEECDDGNFEFGDGCSPQCTVEEGYECYYSHHHSCSICVSSCGDSKLASDEECDDGNNDNDDGCSSRCRVEHGYRCAAGIGDLSICHPVCGDGLKSGLEDCDDGNAFDGDGCNSQCRQEWGWMCLSQEPSVCLTVCGDGHMMGTEECDDGNSSDDDGCTKRCTVEFGFQCNAAGTICHTVCGDGERSITEECDDGNVHNNDGCSHSCRIEDGWECSGCSPTECTEVEVPRVCGDGQLDDGEECDDWNEEWGDGCSPQCTVERGYTCSGDHFSVCQTICGDGYTTPDEGCDDANHDNGDGCSHKCDTEQGYICYDDRVAGHSICTTICGDGEKADIEDCDDGDVVNGDGCSSHCEVEYGWRCHPDTGVCTTICGDGKLASDEECDDGNNHDGDGCSDTCTVESGWTCTGNPSYCVAINTCGDGNLQCDETCDDGNLESGDGCSDDCQVEDGFYCEQQGEPCYTKCGDGTKAGMEECDDENLVPTDGCSPHCTIEEGWFCPGNPSICSRVRVCGDGFRQGSEQCDDGNDASGDGCSSRCELECGFHLRPDSTTPVSSCGDALQSIDEECDDGNMRDGDGCSRDCLVERGWSCFTEGMCGASTCEEHVVCGDGLLGSMEQCDDGNSFNHDGCDGLCNVECGYSCSPQGVCLSECGDGRKSGQEECDDGNHIGGDGCTASCTVEPGWSCIGTCSSGPSQCRSNAVCGDMKTEGLEECDDGNRSSGDGCSSSCHIEYGYSCGHHGVCLSACGDRRKADNEECDDGNILAGDGCGSDCVVERGWLCRGSPSFCSSQAICGDGVAAGHEECDDGNTKSHDGCSASCLVEYGYTCDHESCTTTCGDGLVAGMEECDDGNADSHDGCNSRCTLEPDWLCTGSPSHCVSTSICGDGMWSSNEACDDGNVSPGDGCDEKCEIECGYHCELTSGHNIVCNSVCGDGFKAIHSEECDDGNALDGDGCSSNCKLETGFQCSESHVEDTVCLVTVECQSRCGDGVKASNENCDDGNNDDGDGCSAYCITEKGYHCDEVTGRCDPICGDGYLSIMEECDDGNVDDGDGCDESCEVEFGFNCDPTTGRCVSVCGDGNKASNEGCDDGNLQYGDGCSTACQVEHGWSCFSTPSICNAAVVCGDGYLASHEECDDGNVVDGDGCNSLCYIEYGYLCDDRSGVCVSICGDGLRASPSETCDDGNRECGDGCSESCEIEPGWTCSGNPSSCFSTAVCGDGYVEGKETCDDGNRDSNDGCDEYCNLEVGFFCANHGRLCTTLCGDGVRAGEEECDDGNTQAADGCNAMCVVEYGFTCESSNFNFTLTEGNPWTDFHHDTPYTHEVLRNDTSILNLIGHEQSMCLSVCGDGQFAANEGCDDGNNFDGDGCDFQCNVEHDWICNGSPSLCESVAICGNTEITGGESCDDGNSVSGDGCSAACLIEYGYTCPGFPLACFTTCGDGKKAPREYCDDGNNDSGDGCDSHCKPEEDWYCTGRPSVCRRLTSCGDGVRAGGEECDDGNTLSGDGCASDCKTEHGYQCHRHTGKCDMVCGDGLRAAGEECDDGDNHSGDGCSSNCVIEHGYACPNENEPCFILCGDGILIAGKEGCDDGNAVSGDGCSDECIVEEGFECHGDEKTQCTALCGDGRALGDEECDDFNTYSGDGCSANCQLEYGWHCDDRGLCKTVCGDGMTAGDEECDDGNDEDEDGCTPCCCTIEPGWECQGEPVECRPVCGDGVKISPEECDDFNVRDYDGCSGECLVEPGFSCDQDGVCTTKCGDGIKAYTEHCDDGGLLSGDGCNPVCTVEAGWYCSGEGDSSLCVTVCGDAVLSGTEHCDDGNVVAGDGCDASCHIETGYFCTGSPSRCTSGCGDGFLDITAEQCDDGNTDIGDGCNNDCEVECNWSCVGDYSKCSKCGDGYITGVEHCDDLNSKEGDGCDDECHIEKGYICFGQPSVCELAPIEKPVAFDDMSDPSRSHHADSSTSVVDIQADAQLYTAADQLSSTGNIGTVIGAVVSILAVIGLVIAGFAYHRKRTGTLLPSIRIDSLTASPSKLGSHVQNLLKRISRRSPHSTNSVSSTSLKRPAETLPSAAPSAANSSHLDSSLSSPINPKKSSSYSVGIHNVGVWRNPVVRGDMPGPRLGHSATAVGDKLYIFGGASSEEHTCLNEIYELDCVAMSWRKFNTPSTIKGRFLHSTTLYRGSLYVFGGCDNSGSFDDLHALELKSMKWQRLSPKGVTPPPRFGHTATVVNGRLVVIGGFDEKVKYSDVYLYNFGSNTWDKDSRVDCDVGIYGHLAIGQPGTHDLLLFGGDEGIGLSTFSTQTGILERNISARGDAPSVYRFSSGGVSDGSLFLFGGSFGNLYSNQTHRLHLDTMLWERVVTDGPKPVERDGHSATVIGDKMYVFGGYDHSKDCGCEDLAVLDLSLCLRKRNLQSRAKLESLSPSPPLSPQLQQGEPEETSDNSVSLEIDIVESLRAASPRGRRTRTPSPVRVSSSCLSPTTPADSKPCPSPLKVSGGYAEQVVATRSIVKGSGKKMLADGCSDNESDAGSDGSGWSDTETDPGEWEDPILTELNKDSALMEVESPSTTITLVREVITQGGQFLKYCRNRKPHRRQVWCSEKLDRIYWAKLSSSRRGLPRAYMKTSDIEFVVPGRYTQVMRLYDNVANVDKQLQSELNSRSFSVVSRARTLDLECESMEERDFWVTAFRLLAEEGTNLANNSSFTSDSRPPSPMPQSRREMSPTSPTKTSVRLPPPSPRGRVVLSPVSSRPPLPRKDSS